MLGKTYRCFKWFCAPRGVSSFTATCLFMVSVLLVGFMSAYFYKVIIDNHVLNENPMFKMVTEAADFIKNVHANMSGHRLLNSYQWLHHFKTLIGSNCHIVPDSLKYLRCTGYIMAFYNTFLMHVLLSGTLPVSILACVPIFTSLLSGYINPGNIIMLGIFEFAQAVLSMVIILTFMFLNERRVRSRLGSDRDHAL